MGLFRAIGQMLGCLSPAHIGFVTLLSGARSVGRDVFGNRYYCAKPRAGYKLDRRWVMYKGTPDASIVPPEWHGWLHHQTDVVPTSDTDTQTYRRSWQKPHVPNLTGTSGAYRPPGHVLSGGVRKAATGDYESWIPPQ